MHQSMLNFPQIATVNIRSLYTILNASIVIIYKQLLYLLIL
jgi:hypothetical protein